MGKFLTVSINSFLPQSLNELNMPAEYCLETFHTRSLLNKFGWGYGNLPFIPDFNYGLDILSFPKTTFMLHSKIVNSYIDYIYALFALFW